MQLFKSLILLTSIFSTGHLFASNDLVGTWRSIDDKTGFSKAIVEISKDNNGTYNGTIIDVTPRPGYTPKANCDKCKGADRGKPIIGLQILKNMKRSATNTNEFSRGTVLDPLSGNQYKSTLRLNNSGNRLSIRGFVGIEALGRNQTWLRID